MLYSFDGVDGSMDKKMLDDNFSPGIKTVIKLSPGRKGSPSIGTIMRTSPGLHMFSNKSSKIKSQLKSSYLLAKSRQKKIRQRCSLPLQLPPEANGYDQSIRLRNTRARDRAMMPTALDRSSIEKSASTNTKKYMANPSTKEEKSISELLGSIITQTIPRSKSVHKSKCLRRSLRSDTTLNDVNGVSYPRNTTEEDDAV